MMLWRACGKDRCGWECKSENLDCRSTDARATAENKDELRLRADGCASWEERERNFERGVDDGYGGAVANSVTNCQRPIANGTTKGLCRYFHLYSHELELKRMRR